MHPKTFTETDSKLKEQWRNGPKSDQPLEPGHARPVYFYQLFILY